MLAYLDFLFLSYQGRIGRAAYWLGYLGLGVVQIVALFVVLRLAGGTLAQLELDPDKASPAVFDHVILPVLIVWAILLYPQFAISTKRWHDRGKSGWWWLIALVPIIGGFWVLIEQGFLPGEDGDNYYGPNPAYA